jgi:hypothetical protein
MPGGNLKALYAKSFGESGIAPTGSSGGGGGLASVMSGQPQQTAQPSTNPGWFNQSAIPQGQGVQSDLTSMLNSFDGLQAGNVTGTTMNGGQYNGAGWSNANGVKFYDPYARYQTQQQGLIDKYTQNSISDNPEFMDDPGSLQSREDWFKSMGLDINKTYGQTDVIDNPTGNAGKDLTNAMYEIDPTTGRAVPVQAQNRYEASDWVNQRDTVRDGALFAALATGLGSVMGGSLGAGAMGSSPISNAALAESATTSGLTGASSATPGFGSAGLGGLQLPEEYGRHVATLADSGGTSPFTGLDAASTGSDAHLYHGMATEAGGPGGVLGNMGTSGTVGGVPSMTSWGDRLLSMLPSASQVSSGLKTGGTLMDLIRAGSGVYSSNQQQKQTGQLIDQTQGLFGQDSAYAQALRQKLERADAKAGRASQYGPREVQLQAKLAEMASGQTKTLADLIQQQGGNRNESLNSVIGLVGAGAGAVNQMGGMQGISDTASEWWKNLSSIFGD